MQIHGTAAENHSYPPNTEAAHHRSTRRRAAADRRRAAFDGLMAVAT
jgi:hypothetical protein